MKYLVRIGDCAACHTTRGGVPFAGGVPFRTSYGTIFSTNITSDPTHGIGDWSADEFAHAMRHGALCCVATRPRGTGCSIR